jgi:hypothetical protein
VSSSLGGSSRPVCVPRMTCSGVLVALMLASRSASSHRGAKEVMPEGGYALRRVADVYLCLDGSGVRVFRHPNRAYPEGFPAAPPPQVAVVLCFISVAAARAAGYPLAPTPKGSLLVEATYLTSPPRVLVDSCQAAATRLRFDIPCPTLLPVASFGVSATCPNFCPHVYNGYFVLTISGFVAPIGEVDHLVIAANRSAVAASDAPTTCSGGVHAGTLRVRTTSAAVYICPTASELNGATRLCAGRMATRWYQ